MVNWEEVIQDKKTPPGGLPAGNGRKEGRISGYGSLVEWRHQCSVNTQMRQGWTGALGVAVSVKGPGHRCVDPRAAVLKAWPTDSQHHNRYRRNFQPRHPCFNKSSKWFWRTLQFKNHVSRAEFRDGQSDCGPSCSFCLCPPAQSDPGAGARIPNPSHPGVQYLGFLQVTRKRADESMTSVSQSGIPQTLNKKLVPNPTSHLHVWQAPKMLPEHRKSWGLARRGAGVPRVNFWCPR